LVSCVFWVTKTDSMLKIFKNDILLKKFLNF
jgi:hypothetical protein